MDGRLRGPKSTCHRTTVQVRLWPGRIDDRHKSTVGQTAVAGLWPPLLSRPPSRRTPLHRRLIIYMARGKRMLRRQRGSFIVNGNVKRFVVKRRLLYCARRTRVPDPAGMHRANVSETIKESAHILMFIEDPPLPLPYTTTPSDISDFYPSDVR